MTKVEVHQHKHRCPAWAGTFIDNRLRRTLHSPARLFGEYVEPGMTVLDLGVGYGFTAIGLAELVGPEGRVIAVDAQAKMLAQVRARAEAAGVSERIETVCSPVERLNFDDPVDFANAFFMVHEVDDRDILFRFVHDRLKPSRSFFIAEPKGHVTKAKFADELRSAEAAGFAIANRPRVILSHAAVLLRMA